MLLQAGLMSNSPAFQLRCLSATCRMMVLGTLRNTSSCGNSANCVQGLDRNLAKCCHRWQGSRSRKTSVFPVSARSLATSATAINSQRYDQGPHAILKRTTRIQCLRQPTSHHRCNCASRNRILQSFAGTCQPTASICSRRRRWTSWTIIWMP